MESKDHRQNIGQRAFAIAYAVFRATSRLQNQTFADYLQKESLELVHAAVNGNFQSAKNAITAIEYFSHLACEVGFLTIANAQALWAETKNLLELIDSADFFPEPDISEILKEKFINQPKTKEIRSMGASFISEKNQTSKSISVSQISAKNIVPANGNDRQSAILKKIRETENCRLKDIQEMLPTLSDRTIRYDVQKLIDQGLIERVGAAGPFGYYRVNTNAPRSFEAGPP